MRRSMLRLVALVALLVIVPSECYKILVYIPQMGHSHMMFLGHLADVLVTAGHNVVVYMPEFDTRLQTNATKLARLIRHPTNYTMRQDPNHLSDNAWIRDGEDIREVFYMVSRIASIQPIVCQATFDDQKLMDELKAEQFDLGISEVLSSCGFAIFEKIQLRNYVGAFATNLIPALTEPFGIDNNPSYVPASFARTGDVMTYWERMENLLSTLGTYVIGQFVRQSTFLEYYKKEFNSNYEVTNTIAKSIFVFVNSDEFVEFPRPITHKVVYIGGIAVDQPKPLDGEFKRVMDGANDGAVLISFGSIAQSHKMTPEIKESFIEMFKAFPKIKFIWKYEIDDDVAKELPNVLKRKWVPQINLLGHPNMKAFISHGGMNSVTESFSSGVPIICIPLFGDQMRNAKMVEKRNVAIVLQKQNLTSESLIWAMRDLLTNQRYMASSKRLAEMIAKKPFSAEERFLKHIQFAAEFGQMDNLDSAATKLNFFQYYLIDIVVPLLLSVLLLVYTFVRIMGRICQRISKISKPKSD